MDTTNNRDVDELGRRLAETGLNDLNEADYQAFRTGFASALSEVTQALNLCTNTMLAGRRTEVGSRIKAIDSVVAKLRRKETQLSTMQDIAGCRLTVPTLADLQTAVVWLRGRLNIEREKDYTRRGQKGGYRAIHLIVMTSSGRCAEIQIRTEVQHAWANLSEQLAYSIDRLIKAGGGPPGVRQRLVLLSRQGWLVDSLIEHLRATRQLVEELGEPVQRNFDELDSDAEWGSLRRSVSNFQQSLRLTDILCVEVKDALLALMAALQPTTERDDR